MQEAHVFKNEMEEGRQATNKDMNIILLSKTFFKMIIIAFQMLYVWQTYQQVSSDTFTARLSCMFAIGYIKCECECVNEEETWILSHRSSGHRPITVQIFDKKEVYLFKMTSRLKRLEKPFHRLSGLSPLRIQIKQKFSIALCWQIPCP